MLSRFISKSSQLHRLLTLIPSQTHLINSKPITRNPLYSSPTRYFPTRTPHLSFFSTDGRNGSPGDESATSTTDLWKISSEVDQDIDSVFGVEPGDLKGIDSPNDGVLRNGDLSGGGAERKDWDFGGTETFSGFEEEGGGGGGGGGNEERATTEDNEPWNFQAKGKEEAAEDVFDIVAESREMGLSGLGDGIGEGIEKREDDKQLESEKEALTAVLKGIT